MRFRAKRRLEERLRAEIAEYEDDELVEIAFDEFWEGIGSDENVDPRLRLEILDDLRQAERQLEGRVALGREGRGRLRSLLFNMRLQRERT